MQNKRVTMAPVLAAAGLSLLGLTLVANAQHGGAGNKSDATAPATIKPAAPTADGSDTKKADGSADKKPDAAEIKKLRSELDDLLNQRADLDRKIAEVRGKLGPNSRTQRFELRNGDGAPQVFEFNGDANSLPPEARKQLEEIQKQMRDAFGNGPFGDMQMFDFDFGNGPGPNGGPNTKSLRDRMQQWREQFQNRMQRRRNGAPGEAPGGSGVKPEKPAQGKIKTYDA